MIKSEYLISCDWGTSSFRLYLVRVADGTIMQEIREGLGIKDLMAQWQKSGSSERLDFFLQYLEFRIYLLSKKSALALDALPVFISGMASSSIGMLELPYATLPFTLEGLDLLYKKIGPTENFARTTFLISGLCTSSDVMRGEESQLIGLAGHFTVEQAVAILPGTHSKHVYLQKGKIIDFHTYMTGEFFALLRRHSILQSSLAVHTPAEETDEVYFRKGVIAAQQHNLLSASFHVRTNTLLHQVSSGQNLQYLSGLLIGSELKDLPAGVFLYLCGGGQLQRPYAAALKIIGQHQYEILAPDTVDAAVAQAHAGIYRNANFGKNWTADDGRWTMDGG